MPFRLGKGKGQAAVGNLWNEIGALLAAAAVPEKPAAQHYGGEERLQCQGASEDLHRDHRLDGTAGRAAILLRKREPQQPELGILRPQLAAPALRGLPITFPLLERVAVAEQAIEAPLDLPLLLAQIKIHFSAPAVPCPSPSRPSRRTRACACRVAHLRCATRPSPQQAGRRYSAVFSLAPIAGRGPE